MTEQELHEQELHEFYLSRGGTRWFKADGGPESAAVPVWNFGWVEPDQRTAEQAEAHTYAVAEMPRFAITGSSAAGEKAALWDCSKAANGGNHFKVFRQQLGSCVGNGGGQAVWYLSAVEVVRLGDQEKVLLPFYLLPYGRSRMYSGMRGRGEGSTGSGFAKAIRTDGIVPADTEGLPRWTDNDGITWGREAELEWSDGAAVQEKWLTLSRKHLVKTTAQCRSADDCRDALLNYYPLTLASDWGGQMQCQQQGDPPVLLNRRSGTWMHQMSCISFWDHPTLGEIFYILNSWGPRTHGTPPDDSPPGGFWIKKQDMDSIARQGETFAFSQFDGFPGQPDIPEKLRWLI